MDERLRQLMRSAASGDGAARAALQRARVRAGVLLRFARPGHPTLPSWDSREQAQLVVGHVSRRGRRHILNPYSMALDPTPRSLCALHEAFLHWALEDLRWGEPTCSRCRRELDHLQSLDVDRTRLATHQLGLYEADEPFGRILGRLSTLPAPVAKVLLPETWAMMSDSDRRR